MASTCLVISRHISTTSVCYGKRNFRKFLMYNKRGSREFKTEVATNPELSHLIDRRGTRLTGRRIGNEWVTIPEMVPELIVPSLENFNLKPYVSYKTKESTVRKFTAKDLFNAVYAGKIKEDFETGRLGEHGEPLEPSEYESLTPEQARIQAEKTGSDLFTEKK